jgi:hypothetical protein
VPRGPGRRRLPRGEVDRHALSGSEKVEAGGLCPSACDKGVEGIVATLGVVMRERQASHASSAGDTQRVLNRAVAPPSLQPVLLGQILGIMDQEIGASEELHVAPIAPC